MNKVTLLICVMVLGLAGSAGGADAKVDVKTKLLSTHETEATFAGIEYRTCRGLTGACPERCGSSGEYAIFKIEKYLKYEKPGKYGDAKAKDRRIHISDFHKKPKGDPKLNEIIKGLTKGDRVLLSWNHNYVTRTYANGTSSSAPERPITKLQKGDLGGQAGDRVDADAAAPQKEEAGKKDARQDRQALQLGRKVLAVKAAIQKPTSPDAMKAIKDLGLDSRHYVMVRGWLSMQLKGDESILNASKGKTRPEIRERVEFLKRAIRAIDLE